MSSRPNTSHGAGSSSVPLIKSFRFSTSHDAHNVALANGTTTSSSKRSSRLQEYLGRSRTASLPPRPHTSGGLNQGLKRLTLSGKGKEVADDDSQNSAASSSVASTTDPFAAHPSASASFVTYSPTVTTNSPYALPNSSRARTSHAQSITSQIASPTSPSPPQSPAISNSHSSSSGSNSNGTKRRGSILHAASDAFSRMNPIRARSISKQPMAGVRVTSPTPIVLTEVIEISESAVRASKRREAEEEERERLRDAAARALGIGDVDAEVSSSQSYFHADDEYEDDRNAFHGEEFGVRELDDANQETPGATGLPALSSGNSTISSHTARATHTRSRSGSFLPLALNSLQRPSTPKAPSVMSQTTSVPPAPPVATVSAKSFSTPPTMTLAAAHRPPPLNVNTLSPPRLGRTPSNRTATSGSTLPMSVHSRTHAHDRTLPPPKIPPFPTKPALLAPFAQRSVTVPRYYPAPTLLMFALAKQWKNRYFMLTSPLPAPSVSSPPLSPTAASSECGHLAPWYLHMFKSSGPDEREVERLEIDDESMAYVADGEVGGRRSVVKFEGILRRRAVHHNAPNAGSSAGSEEGPAGGEEGRTTWIVQILDVEETQKWIEAIKGAVLNQRAIRAGLSAPSAGAIEPRGDLDVILSMRAQGFSNVPPSPLQVDPVLSNAMVRAQGAMSPTTSHYTGDGSRSSPTSSLTRSQGTALSAALSSYALNGGTSSSSANVEAANSISSPTRTSMSATSALKNLFTIGGGRPRSPSTTSLSVHAPSPSFPDEYNEDVLPDGDSFGRAGNNLLSMLRNGSFTSDRPMSPTTSVPSTPRVGTPAEQLLDRKILPDSDRHLVETEGCPETAPRAPTALGLSVGLQRDRDGNVIIPGRVSTDMGSQSLQPPPRKRAGTTSSITMSTPTSTEPSGSYPYAHTNESTAESLGVKNPNLLAPSPPTSSSPSSSRPKDRRARTSWSSVSSWASNDHPPSSPEETRTTRRWSRRSSHPYRLSPPYGPPPATPPSSPQSRGLRTPPLRHPYAADDTLSRSSSIGSSPSPETLSRPLSPKRASGESFSTVSTTQSRMTGIGAMSIFSHGPRPRSSHRASMPPPPRPAPHGALPPTPGEGLSAPATPLTQTQSAPGSRSSFRDSFNLRAQRFSLSPPVNSSPGLPRADEPGRRPSSVGHRRSSSIGSNTGGTPLYPIPASPTRTKSPFPPPSGPLPPTPPSPTLGGSSSPTRSPRPSLTRRLRMLSSPPSSPPQSFAPIPPSDASPPTSILLPPAHIVEFTTAAPHTPIGEPITTLQNDPDFLRTTPSPPRTPLSGTPVLAPEGFVPLSPPPRRSSRQVSSQEKAGLNQEILSSTSVVLVVTNEDEPSPNRNVGDAPAPPPEVDDFASLLAPVPRSPGRCAVSLVDVSI